MSALSRGSRTKVKQLNGSIDSATTQGLDLTITGSNSADNVAPPTMAPIPSLPVLGDAQLAIEPSAAIGAILSAASRQSNADATSTTALADIEHVSEMDHDDRSSSLSDVEDRPTAVTNEKRIGNSSPMSDEAAYDTEAETERLEESPHKGRKQLNITLSVSNKATTEDVGQTHTVTAESSRSKEIAVPVGSHGKDHDDNFDQTSDITSLGDSDGGGESRAISSTTFAGKKRKRSDQEHSENPTDDSPKASKRVATLVSRMVSGEGDVEETELTIREDEAKDVEDLPEDGDLSDLGDEDAGNFLHPINYTSRRADGTEKMTEELGTNGLVSRDISPGAEDNLAEVRTIEGDADVDEPGGDADIEVTTRNEEEIVKKRAALDSLGAIEKDFATLRDKLFDERLTQLNDELEMLNQPNVTHPEYLAMMEAIDRRRDEKIEMANTRLRYKLQALENKTVATRSICHGQYMQDVREITDTTLQEANKEWYAIQRERRAREEDESNFACHFQPRRSKQIINQTAYNTEVSILSGIAKYRGFPAAPEIKAAKTSDVEDDLRRMGSAAQPAPLRIGPTLSNLSRARPAAEEQFLEQTPWANPQHPSHQMVNPAQRQISQSARPFSPFTTPASQKRATESEAPNGSASTIAILHSAQGSSVAPTPLSIEQTIPNHSTSNHTPGPSQFLETPSRRNGQSSYDNELPRRSASTVLDDSAHKSTYAVPESTRSQEQTYHPASPSLNFQASSSNIPAGTFRGRFSSPFQDSNPRTQSPRDKPYGSSLHTQIPRQVSVGTGVGPSGG